MARNPATMVVLNKSSLSLFSSVLVHNFPLYVRCELSLKHITCQCKKWLFKDGENYKGGAGKSAGVNRKATLFYQLFHHFHVNL